MMENEAEEEQLRSGIVNESNSNCNAGGGGNGGDGDINDDVEAEQQKLCLLRTCLESRDPSSKGVDDLMLRRFLRARDLDVEKAAKMFLKYLDWRRTFLPKGFVSEAEIQYDISHNKLFVGGIDKKGRPIIVVFAGRHFQNPKPGGVDEFKRYVVYTLDKICSRMPPGQEKFTAIAEIQGWGYSNSDIRGYLAAVFVLQDCYPERLGKMIMVHVPRIFMTAWKIISPFIDSNTRRKIVFAENKNLKSTLLEDIDESQLPDVYGGKIALVPIQDA